MSRSNCVRALAFLALLFSSAPAWSILVVNEVDYDQPGSDTAEFIEIKNTTAGPIDLSLYQVRLVNGATGLPYTTIALPAQNLAAGGYFVICVNAANTPNCAVDLTANQDAIQNGPPDAVAIARISDSVIIDTLSYEGDTAAPYTEGIGFAGGDDSVTANIGVTRFPDGADSNNNNSDFSIRCITPGVTNSASTSGCPAPPPNPTLSITAPAPTAEGSIGGCTTTPFTFTVNASAAPASDLNFTFSSVDGTAQDDNPVTEDNDYVPRINATGVILGGTSSAQVTVNVNCDDAFEADETFSVALQAGFAYIVSGSNGSALATINNDDLGTVPRLSIADATKQEGDLSNGSQMQFAITITLPAPAGGVTFNVATQVDTGPNPATAGSDYTTTTVTGALIPAGFTSVNFNVPIADDSSAEQIETFRAVVTNLSANANLQDGIAIGSITDNEFTLSIAVPPTFLEPDGASAFCNFTASLNSPLGSDLQFTATANSGSATPGTDYQPFVSQAFTITGGSISVAVPVSVFGDIIPDPGETITVTIQTSDLRVTIPAPNGGTATVTVNDDDPAPTTIAAIQGDAAQSPVNNTAQVTNGNIVTAKVGNGFFMQMQTPDGLLDTSDAMFVFTSSAPSVNVGDLVNVKGTVVEASVTVPAGEPNYSSLTKFRDAGLTVIVAGSAVPAPAAFVLDAAMPSPEPSVPFCAVAGGSFLPSDFVSTQNFECLESMRVRANTGIVSSPNQSFSGDPIAEHSIMPNGQRAFREAGVRYDLRNEDVGIINGAPTNLTPPAPVLAPAPIFDMNPEMFEIDLDRLGLPNTALVPGTEFTATGILAYEFGGYELFPETFNVIGVAPTLPRAVPLAVADQISIASANVLHLYNNINDPGSYDDCSPGSADECPTAQEYQDKLNKLSLYIRNLLRAPMVVALQEVENTNTLQALANKINTDSAGAVSYSIVMGADQNNDPGHINSGFLVRSDVTLNATTQLLTTDTWIYNGASQGTCDDASPFGCLHNRPPILLEATTSIGGSPVAFAVLALHLRSLLDVDDITPLADQVAAHRARQKRLRSAHDVAEIVQSFQTLDPGVPLVVVGDFNAFEYTDGYADILGIIRGDYLPSENEYPIDFADLNPGTGPNGNITVPTLGEAALALPRSERYSYSFASNSQILDHALLSTAATARFERMAFVRANSDSIAAPASDPNTPLRSSDHDAFVVYLNAGSDPTNNGYTIFKDGFDLGQVPVESNALE